MLLYPHEPSDNVYRIWEFLSGLCSLPCNIIFNWSASFSKWKYTESDTSKVAALKKHCLATLLAEHNPFKSWKLVSFVFLKKKPQSRNPWTVLTDPEILYLLGQTSVPGQTQVQSSHVAGISSGEEPQTDLPVCVTEPKEANCCRTTKPMEVRWGWGAVNVVRRGSYTLKKQDGLFQGAAKGLENQGEALEKETRRQGRVVVNWSVLAPVMWRARTCGFRFNEP